MICGGGDKCWASWPRARISIILRPLAVEIEYSKAHYAAVNNSAKVVQLRHDLKVLEVEITALR